MSQLNKVIIMGNLTRDPELKELADGTQMANLRLAINRWSPGKSKNKNEVCYITVVAWEKLAVACEQYLKKGSTIVVEGRLNSRQWVGPDRIPKVIVEVIATLINFMGKKDEIPASLVNYDEKGLDEDKAVLEELSY